MMINLVRCLCGGDDGQVTNLFNAVIIECCSCPRAVSGIDGRDAEKLWNAAMAVNVVQPQKEHSMYRVTIEEIIPAATEGLKVPGVDDVVIERLRQTVDVIDLPGVMRAINTKPRAPRIRRKADTPAAPQLGGPAP